MSICSKVIARTDRQTDRHTHTHRQTHGQTDRHTDTDTTKTLPLPHTRELNIEIKRHLKDF